MFDLLPLAIARILSLEPTRQQRPDVPIHVAAEQMALRATDKTVIQFNNACVIVCDLEKKN
jgi:hypothetical protein